MVFKWFNMMIKMRQNCGANYEIMQINEKYSKQNEAKRNKKKWNDNIRAFEPIRSQPLIIFLCFCWIFCSCFYVPGLFSKPSIQDTAATIVCIDVVCQLRIKSFKPTRSKIFSSGHLNRYKKGNVISERNSLCCFFSAINAIEFRIK